MHTHGHYRTTWSPGRPSCGLEGGYSRQCSLIQLTRVLRTKVHDGADYIYEWGDSEQDLSRRLKTKLSQMVDVPEVLVTLISGRASGRVGDARLGQRLRDILR